MIVDDNDIRVGDLWKTSGGWLVLVCHDGYNDADPTSGYFCQMVSKPPDVDFIDHRLGTVIWFSRAVFARLLSRS